MGPNSFLYDDIYYGSVCFWVSVSEKDLANAQTTCSNKGGSLAIITDSAMQNIVNTLLNSAGTIPNQDPSLVETSSAAITTDTVATTLQSCTCPAVQHTSAINSTEELNRKIAEIRKELEVEKSSLSSTIRRKTSADDSRPSAKTFGGLTNYCNGLGTNTLFYNESYGPVCFWVSTIKRNLTSAQTKCVDEGGSLAIVKDDSTNTAVNNFLDSVGRGNSEVYIGYDVDTTSNYKLTTLSGQAQQYENFYAKNLNHADWHCVSLYLTYWYAEKCDHSYYFLCSTIPNRVPSNIITTESATTTESPATTTKSLTTTESTSSITEPTSPSTMLTATSSTSQNCTCPEGCVVRYTATINSTEELNAKIAEIKKEIQVEKSTLSSSVRKKTSATDSRPSAKTFGFVGIIIITFVLGGIVALDFPMLIVGLKKFGACAIKLIKK
ncbi:serine-rich adhesin for platelets-like [Saccostrea echinata]|uniref:serine-rich adhesin for platelets-like n=1 Tax=Saccostrea echinata TaxID=191078 RepID=UPI002A802363|nr:serine-rich adhesin for platelets-like [Saccostrea echinata]